MIITTAVLIGTLVAVLLAPFTSWNRDFRDYVVAFLMCILLVGIPTGAVAYAVMRAVL